MVNEVSQSVRNTLLTRLGAARAMQRVASPSIVIGLGSVSYTHLTLPTNREV